MSSLHSSTSSYHLSTWVNWVLLSCCIKFPVSKLSLSKYKWKLCVLFCFHCHARYTCWPLLQSFVKHPCKATMDVAFWQAAPSVENTGFSFLPAVALRSQSSWNFLGVVVRFSECKHLKGRLREQPWSKNHTMYKMGRVGEVGLSYFMNTNSCIWSIGLRGTLIQLMGFEPAILAHFMANTVQKCHKWHTYPA